MLLHETQEDRSQYSFRTLFTCHERTCLQSIWFVLFYVLVFKLFVLLAPNVCFHIQFKVIEWPPTWKIAAPSAYDMFSWY